MWVAFNIGPVLVGAYLVTYVEPVAGGSGIPQVKSYLNGIKIPRVVRIKTLIVKIVGVISTVVGGLAGGKEGPMIHAGAVVAAGLSQGKSTTFNTDFRIFQYFREDHEKRDFVAGGAAAGVSAAFGAPIGNFYFHFHFFSIYTSNLTNDFFFFFLSKIGGVLFSLEEGTSFFNQSLTWRVLFASMISTFTLNIVLSTYHGVPGDLSFPGLLNLGKFETMTYSICEIPLFILMGIIGGLMGSLWNHINFKISCFRAKYVREKWMKIIDVIIIAAITATIGFLMIYYIDDCQPERNPKNPPQFPVKMFCKDNEHSAVAALWFQTPERTVRSLFHDDKGKF